MKPGGILLLLELPSPGNWGRKLVRKTVAPGGGLSLLISVELGAAEELRILAHTSVLLVTWPSNTVTYRNSCSPP
jgi:hypothetical protein